MKKASLISLLTLKGPLSFKIIVKNLGIKINDNKEFSKFLFTLIKSGEIFLTFDKLFYIPKFIKRVTGIISLNSRGFGFVDLENNESIFISPNNIFGAMNKDIVEIDVFQSVSKENKSQGIVINIAKRARSSFVGRVIALGEEMGLVPFDNTIKGRFKFIDPQKVKINQEVKVKIVKYGDPIEVTLEKFLGYKDDIAMDVLIAIEDSGVPHEFNSKIFEHANKISTKVLQDDLKNRVDLRNNLIVTIDGDDTKDFDDAIEVKKIKNGNFILSVHIADVTSYVKEGDPFDEEAKLRGTSVYLVDRVIPMLPEVLSTGICSLKPNVDRLTISVDMEINSQGKTVDYKVYPSVINSKYRLTYQEVNKFYRNNFSWNNKKLHLMLNEALELSNIIRKFKEKEGYIDFEIEESKIVVDQNGQTQKIVARERLESELMIENFMVRTNEVVSEYVEKNNLSFIYRIHDKPNLDKIDTLQKVVKLLNIDVKLPHHPVPIEFAKSINEIKKTRFDNFIKIMMLRTMAKAIYSSQNIGHFGLASKSYTHFTSPIRRYPDLMVHRMLREYFFNSNKKMSNHFNEILPSISEHSSLTEQRAVELERKIIDMKKAEFYEKFVGKSFQGTIVSIAKFGFFVEFPDKVDGLVHVSSLVDGDYQLTKDGYGLTNNKTTYKIGDFVNTTVSHVSKKEGKINLVITNLYLDWRKRNGV